MPRARESTVSGVLPAHQADRSHVSDAMRPLVTPVLEAQAITIHRPLVGRIFSAHTPSTTGHVLIACVPLGYHQTRIESATLLAPQAKYRVEQIVMYAR